MKWVRLCIRLGKQFEGAFENQTNATRVAFSWQFVWLCIISIEPVAEPFDNTYRRHICVLCDFIFQSCVFICLNATKATKNASFSANLKVSPRYGNNKLAQFWNRSKNISMKSRFFCVSTCASLSNCASVLLYSDHCCLRDDFSPLCVLKCCLRLSALHEV